MGVCGGVGDGVVRGGDVRGRFWSGKSVQVGKRLEIRFPTPARLQIRVQRVVEKVRGLSGMVVVRVVRA